jgi:hypothetical protein
MFVIDPGGGSRGPAGRTTINLSDTLADTPVFRNLAVLENGSFDKQSANSDPFSKATKPRCSRKCSIPEHAGAIATALV